MNSLSSLLVQCRARPLFWLFVMMPLAMMAQPTVSVSPTTSVVVAGGWTTFTAHASGSAPITYQWRKNGVAISGEIGSSLYLGNIPLSDNGSVYTVAATNAGGTTVSGPGTLTVVPALAITTQPAPATVNVGSSATFTVAAAGATTYQWRKNGVAIAGATQATYITPPTVAGDNGSNFSVLVSGQTGSILSNQATLTVRILPVITKQPANGGVNAGQTLASPFSVEATGTPPITFQWLKNGVPVPGATSSTFTPPPGVPTDNGSTFSVVVTDAVGSVTSSGANLTVRFGASIVTQPADQTVAPGGTVTFTTVATGNPAPEHQWQRLPAGGATWTNLSNNATFSGVNTAALTVIGAPLAMNGDRFRCIATVVHLGQTLGEPATTTGAQLTVQVPDPARLANVSIRAGAGSDSQTLIVGFTVGGTSSTDTKPLLIRGAGPALVPFGVSDALADPIITVFDGTTVVAANDDWSNDATVILRAAALGAFPFTANSRDSALVSSIPPKGYTVQLTGKSAASGVALVEVWDATSTFAPTTARLTNVSARTQVGTDGNILITGFVVAGNGTRRVLVRAVGPALAPFGVTGVLADPTLELFRSVDGQSSKIAENNDWEVSTLAAQNSVGAFSLTVGSRDAVLVALLEPGNYTAQVTGVGRTTGVALVEIYELP